MSVAYQVLQLGEGGILGRRRFLFGFGFVTWFLSLLFGALERERAVFVRAPTVAEPG